LIKHRKASGARSRPLGKALVALCLVMISTGGTRAALEWKVLMDPSDIRDIAVTGASVWGVGRGGLVRLDIAGEAPGYLTSGEGLVTNDLNAILASSDDELWIATNGSGLVRYRPGDSSPWYRFSTLPQGLASDRLFCLTIGPEGRLWYGSDSGLGVMEANGPGEVWTAQEGLNNETVYSLLWSGDVLVIGTAAGVYYLNPDGEVLAQAGNPQGAVTDLVFADDSLWALAGGGLWRRDVAGGDWESIVLPVAGYAALALDAEADRLALTLEETGNDPAEDRVYRYDPASEVWTNLSAGLLRDSAGGANDFYPAYKSLAYTTLRLAGEEIWLGGEFEQGLGPGILHWDTADWAHMPLDDRPIGVECKSVSYGPSGNIWAMSRIGTARLTGESWTRYPSDPTFCLLPKDGLDIMEDSQGWVYFTRYSECLGRIDLSGELPSEILHSDIKINRMAQDALGNRWFGTDGSGILLLDAADEMHDLNVETAGLPGNQIDRIDFLPDGRIVLLIRSLGVHVWDTRGTLLEKEGDDWFSVSGESADPGNLLDADTQFSSVSVDASGGFWVGQASGLIYVEPDGSGFRVAGRIGRIPGSSEGLLSDQVSDVAASPDGSVWAGNSLGLSHVWIDPATGAWKVENYTNEAGLAVANLSGNIFSRNILTPLPHQEVMRLACRADGEEIFLGTKTGFARIRILPDAPPPPETVAGAYLYPNPVDVSFASAVYLGGVEHAVTVEVYNLEGQLVASPGSVEPETVLWNLTTRFGSKAVSGVYIIRIEDRGQVVLRNLVLAR
jgi:ligand-binding sensor domain-containing protein